MYSYVKLNFKALDNRAALYGPKPEYTELDLDDKDCVIDNYRWLDMWTMKS